MRRSRDHAVVVGASMGGLAAARVLADRFGHVTVLDRDDLPAEPGPRKTVPQGRHAHALLAGGLRAIVELFPGIVEEMTGEGAAVLDFNDGLWFQAGNYRAPILTERHVISASRPFIEAHLRRRVAALPNVTIESGATVDGLAYDGDQVRGATRSDGGVMRTLNADFVVDASGRGSAAPRWLEAIGYPAPEVVEVPCDVRYGTIVLERRPADIDGTFAVTIESPPNGKRAGFALPIEGDRWIVTIAASFGADAPTDEASFRAIAATLPAPQVFDLVTRATALAPVMTHRLPSSRRRRFEKQARVPTGFVALGDAICSFNPIYGQGMSSAVLQAVELGKSLDAGERDDRLPRHFYKRAAKVIESPWKIAVGADLAYPECTGRKPAGTDLVNRYLHRVLLAAQVSAEVNTTLVLVQNLLAPPTALMRPSLVPKVLRAAREAERRNEAQPVTRRTPALA